MPSQRVSHLSLSAFLVTALLIFVPAPARAATITLNCAAAPGSNIMDLRVIVDTSASKLSYQYMNDGKPWSKVGIVQAKIDDKVISWRANKITDVETRSYDLDRKTNQAMITDQENGSQKRFIKAKWNCHPN